jgi:hypothetical protein
MTTYGEIIDIIGSEKLVEDVMSGLHGADQNQLSMMKETFKQFVGKDALKGSLEMSLRCFAENPVGIGDSWTNQTEIAAGIHALVSTTWKLTDRKGGVSMLEGTSSLKSKEKAAPQMVNGISITYDIKGETKTFSKIDEKTGWVIELTADQDISGDMLADLTTQGSGQQKIPIKIKSKITMKGIQ